MQWNMQQADDIQFLAVSGTMVVGDVKAKYDFTLVVYRMHIDEVDWTIFSTLDNALVNEFTEYFWKIVNYRRKDRRGFVDVPWIDTQQEYEVAPAYREVRLSIFNNLGYTVRVTTPFIYRDTYLKVHPNAAAVSPRTRSLNSCFRGSLKRINCSLPLRFFGAAMTRLSLFTGRLCGYMKTQSSG